MNDLLQKHYVFNSASGFWHREEVLPFSYSDGEDVEDGLLRSLRDVEDKSVMSEELFALQKDWPTCYHLSAMRANLLRPLAETALHQAKVLELGCGCGAISRYLAETAAEVCAVEGSTKRAAIAAARCGDLHNIHIVADSIQNLPPALGRFDVVTLIGVLEYAALFDAAATPALSLLRIARNFLKEDGCLILAIENKMGLKYFAGIPEDHLSIAWGGIAGAYRDGDVRTYSRHELTALLEKAGFVAHEQFIPVPDYKLPTGILTPAGIRAPGDEWDAAPLLGDARDYEEQGIFNLPNAWRSVVDAGLLPEMANSLCFTAHIAKKQGTGIWDKDTLMYHYGRAQRDNKKYAECAAFKRVGQDIYVNRQHLCSTARADEAAHAVRPESEAYIRGRELLEEVRSATARPGWTVADLARAFRPWVDALRNHVDDDWMLPASLCGASAVNARLTPTGEVKFVNPGRIAKEPVPFLPTVTADLYTAFSRMGGVYPPEAGTPTAYPELALALLKAWGFYFSLDDLKVATRVSKTPEPNAPCNSPSWESLCQSFLFVTPSVSFAALAASRGTLQKERDTFQEERDALRMERDSLQGERDAAYAAIHGYETSRSWRLTAPLRAAACLYRRRCKPGMQKIVATYMGLLSALRRMLRYYRENGLRAFIERSIFEIRRRGIRQFFFPAPLPTAPPGHFDLVTGQDDQAYEDACPYIQDKASLKAIAFYLPQFHPFPENDLWWGKGFTEWTNVRKATPLFPGHYHPKEPGVLGYYDLRSPGVMQKQAEMAKKFGLHGFCFHYYWFAGKRLMERPVDDLLKDSSIDLPFCLNWANENWTRRWDGHDQEILIRQQHSPDDDLGVINDLMRYFRDPRYIRLDGRPLLLVYRPSLFPDMRLTLERWRNECLRQGEKTPFFAMCQSFNNYAPKPYGFDAAVQFPPHMPLSRLVPEQYLPAGMVPDFAGAFYLHESVVSTSIQDYKPELPAYPGLFPAWDNTARLGKKAHVFYGCTPKLYSNWLATVGEKVKKHFPPDRQLVFINAWNEWAEGAYLEPDLKHGYAYLNATSKTLAYLEKGKKPSSDTDPADMCILFVGHDAYLAGAQVVLLHTLRWLKLHSKIDIKLLLLGDGVMRRQFEQTCDTLVAGESLPSFDEIRAFCPKPDVICANTVVSSLCFNEIKRYQVPIVTWLHEMEQSIKKFSTPESVKMMIDNSVFYMAASEPIKENLVLNRGIDADLISVINAFIDAAKEPDPADKAKMRTQLGLPANGFLITGMGTLDWRKGTDLFVDAAKMILDKMPDADISFCWIGIGNDPDIRDPKLLAKEYGIEKRVFFVGARENSGDYLQASDLFLLTSREDPFPLVALEACAACLPVICFADAGGMPEFIAGGAGIVTPYEDVAAMAEAASQLLRDHAGRAALGKAARRLLLEKHTVDSAVPHILATLRKVAGKPHPVSVIVPNYNYADYLPQRLESIFKQTYRDMEVIILDDASSDGSLEVIEQWEGRAGVRVLVNETNSGKVNLQWQKGLLEAKGQYIWIAEADDSCEADFLEKMLQPFRDSDLVLAYSIPRVIDSDGLLAGDFDYRKSYLAHAGENLWNCSYIIDGKREAREKLGIVNCIPNVSSTLFRRAPALKAIGKSLNFICSGDWMFYLAMASAGAIAYVHGDIALHRRHARSVVAADLDNKNAILREEAQRIHSWVIDSFAPDEQTRKKMTSFLESIV